MWAVYCYVFMRLNAGWRTRAALLPRAFVAAIVVDFQLLQWMHSLSPHDSSSSASIIRPRGQVRERCIRIALPKLAKLSDTRVARA